MRKVKYSKNKNISFKKKKSHKDVIWGLFIAIIMVGSIVGFLYSGGGEADYTYNDKFKFTRTDAGQFIYTDSADNRFNFRFLPYDVEEFNIVAEIKPPMVLVSFDPTSANIDAIELMRFELMEDLGKLDIFTKQGITMNNSLYNMEIIDCSDATADIPVIKFVSSNETSIIEENNCIILKAKDKVDTVKLKERVLYKVLGIVE